MKRPLPILLCLAVLLLGAAGCERSEPRPADREELERVLGDYLHALADAYSEMNLEPLDGLASPNEIAAVHKLLRQLAGTGDRIDATLRGFEILDLEVFREINATAKLIEVWDLVRYDVYSGRVKGRTEGSLQSTLIQLRRVDGDWIVIGRSILDRPTPAPDETAPDETEPDEAEPGETEPEEADR